MSAAPPTPDSSRQPWAAHTAPLLRPPLIIGWLIWGAMVFATQGIPRLTFRNAIQFLSLTLGSPVGLLLLCGWWLLASRGWGRARWTLPLACLLALGLCGVLFFPGPALPALIVYGPPVVVCGWLAGVALGKPRGLAAAHLAGLVGQLLGLTLLGLVRVEGTDGAMNPRLAWRWMPTAEQRLLDELRLAPRPALVPAQRELAIQPGDWPGFRGPARDSINHSDQIEIDWETHPPRELWRSPVGPGWGSFAIVDGWLFTQQQRGDDECVTAYDAATGMERWSHAVSTRYEEAISGAGPRGTPLFHEGKIYSCGANGHLSCCEARTGRLIWSVELTELGGLRPYWGYASSPLAEEGLLWVYLGGGPGKGLAAFDLENGGLKWTCGEATHSYSSPHATSLHGERQILLVSEVGIEAFSPHAGTLRWKHEWRDPGINRDVQPLFDGDDVILSTGIGGEQGWRRLQLRPDPEGWQTQVQWSQRSLRPYYNDAVRLGEHVFGFDQDIFTCVSLKTGTRQWRAGRYGSGQVLLLQSQQLLLVQAETGDVVLLEADPRRHRELGRFSPLASKTWNHPVVVGSRLYVRNDQEMACFDLSAAKVLPGGGRAAGATVGE